MEAVYLSAGLESSRLPGSSVLCGKQAPESVGQTGMLVMLHDMLMSVYRFCPFCISFFVCCKLFAYGIMNPF